MSGTIIDALVVTLGLDAKEFASGAKAATDGLKGIEAETEKVDQAGAKAARSKTQRDQQGRTQAERDTREAAKRRTDEQKAIDKERSEEVRREKAAALEKAKADRQAAKERKESLDRVKEAALGFGAAFASMATAKWVESTASNVADLGRAAHNLNLATPVVRAWANAVETVGGSADAAVGSLETLQKGLVGVRVGDTSLLGPLNEIGAMSGHPIDIKGQDGKIVDEMELLKRVMEATKGMDPGLRSVELGKLGLDTGTINAGVGGRAGIDAAIAAATRRGVPSDKEAAEDAKIAAGIAELQQKFRRLGEQLVFELSPQIGRVISDLGSELDLFTGKISLEEFGNQYAQHRFDARVKALTNQGMDPVRARGKVGAQVLDENGKSPWDFTNSYTYSGLHWLSEKLGIVDPANPGASSPSSGDTSPGAIKAYVESDAASKGLNPKWMSALFRAENRFRARGVSSSGNFGPGQISADVARQFGVATSQDAANYDPRANVDAGLQYFKLMLSMYGNRYDVATLAYHDGPNAASTRSYAYDGSTALLGPQARSYLETIKAANDPSMRFSPGGGAGGDTSVETHIGTVNVNAPSAKDANAIARGMRDAIHSHPLVVNANSGMQ